MNRNKVIHTSDENEMLITQLFVKYFPYWSLLLLLILISALSAFVYIRYATPKYEATATLVINDEKKGTEDSKLIESLNIISTKKIIENETEVLQSRTLMDKVVKTLHLYAPVFVEGEIRDMSGYMLAPVRIEAENPELLIQSPKLYVKYKSQSGEIFIDDKKAGEINTWIDTKYGRIKFSLNSQPISYDDSKRYFFRLLKIRDVTKILLSDLNIKALNKLSSIINISYKDEVPERAEKIVNTLIATYNKSAIDEKNMLAQNTLDFVEQRLNSVSRDIDSIEKLVQNYKTGSGSIDISSQGQYYLKNVSENDQELGRINMQLGVLDQLENNINNSTSGGLMPATVGITDQNISKLMTDLSDKELEYERLRKTVAENNPMLISLKDQINKLRPSISENLKNQRDNLQASRGRLYATNNKYNSILSSIPMKERQILEISRDQNVKNGIYSFLLQKREETKLSYASNISHTRIINNALATKKPVSPNKLMIYLLSVTLAAGVFILTVTLKDGLNKKIQYRKEIENFTDVPVIAEITEKKPDQSLLIEPGKRTFIAEEFRKLNIALSFQGIGKEKKRILVTSGIPGEGKSFIAANLAISNSAAGKKVLLIDLDLHKPSIDTVLKLEKGLNGMSEYLMGTVSLKDIVKKSDKYANLYVIPSGSIQPNASELILNENLPECLDYFNKEYDLLVIDIAPTEMITDAFVVSRYCDITLYTIRHNYTPKILIKRLEKNQSNNPLKNLSIIFNSIKSKVYLNNEYGYGYKYIYRGKNKEYYSDK